MNPMNPMDSMNPIDSMNPVDDELEKEVDLNNPFLEYEVIMTEVMDKVMGVKMEWEEFLKEVGLL